MRWRPGLSTLSPTQHTRTDGDLSHDKRAPGRETFKEPLPTPALEGIWHQAAPKTGEAPLLPGFWVGCFPCLRESCTSETWGWGWNETAAAGFVAEVRTACFLGLQGEPHFPGLGANIATDQAWSEMVRLQRPSLNGSDSSCCDGFPSHETGPQTGRPQPWRLKPRVAGAVLAAVCRYSSSNLRTPGACAPVLRSP